MTAPTRARRLDDRHRHHPFKLSRSPPTTRSAKRHHPGKQCGYLLATSSMAAFVHSPLQAPYTASKAGIWAMCNSIRLEVRHLGVGVGTLHPTFLKTPMLDAIHADPAGRLLWGGNERGLWRMCTVDKAVRSIVSGIERRAQTITACRTHALVAAAPGFFRPFIDRLGFTTTTITETSAASSRSGGLPPTSSTVSREFEEQSAG
ncbi:MULTISPECIES: SDR family NAD(P)-dependent oxidoreductase [unclassified Streptomyces]|uniref:SDR family NAD(P)-dependent oxidoreductase n=1 Tax=unclassified Streptomyces TaxID=2593676 RepID=UPI003407BC6D